jgi:hypothetical protein
VGSLSEAEAMFKSISGFGVRDASARYSAMIAANTGHAHIRHSDPKWLSDSKSVAGVQLGCMMAKRCVRNYV